ncbi:MAG: hypothetical protein CM15mP22_4270 [Gammaproteobacteria bacterium]|nr:MAG: hypothetical protein CM15mP22_4270 [Gammaproteobacteria bacterium]
MSLGSISTEAHESLALAMNKLGGKSNTGREVRILSVSNPWKMENPKDQQLNR